MKSLSKYVVFALLVIILFNEGMAYFQDSNEIDEQKNEVILEGIDMLYSGKFEESIEHFKRLGTIDPSTSEHIFFEAFVLEFMMDQYRSDAFDERFNEVVDIALEKAKNAVDADPSARNHMFLGGAYGVKGVRKGILGAWWQAYRNGSKANGNMLKAVEIDSTLYDAYYGIGSYNYWASRKLRKFLGFFVKDKRMQGIEELKMTIDKGRFSARSGRMALFRIYIEEKWYDEVLTLADELLGEMPEVLFPRWYLGVALIRTEQWDKAVANYEKILQLLENVDFNGPESLIEPWYYISLSKYNLKKYQESKELLEKILPYKGKVNKHLFYYSDYVDDAEDLLKKVNKAMK